ncbi:hypothetical protein NC653_003325 [Populus alba x Populus x berolinensis]|uniref:Uncharacterized protein n=1 Tax=Populus alba x Populus x berolinensis TaxID=444605 RepID=A0AAD6RRB2_9ROSI|nr:hypothetical protein NC653_003325 [Populus alba x Populus x berolinensis]
MAYKPFLNKAPSAMDKSVNLLKIPMVMMILLIARRRAPSLNLMLFSLMRTQQLLDDDGYDFLILIVWLNLCLKKG